MKKKIYMTPDMDVVKLNVAHPLLEASIQLNDGNASGPGMAREVEFSFDGEY